MSETTTVKVVTHYAPDGGAIECSEPHGEYTLTSWLLTRVNCVRCLRRYIARVQGGEDGTLPSRPLTVVQIAAHSTHESCCGKVYALRSDGRVFEMGSSHKWGDLPRVPGTEVNP